jgi:hypothetical protein
MSSTKDSTDRCLEMSGDIRFCQVFNVSFFSKSTARHLKIYIHINPERIAISYRCVKSTFAKLLATQYLASQLEQPYGL